LLLGYADQDKCYHFHYERERFKERDDLFVSEHIGYNRNFYVFSAPTHHFSRMFPFGASRQEVYDSIMKSLDMNFFDLHLILKELTYLNKS
jgi:hypothetical protein